MSDREIAVAVIFACVWGAFMIGRWHGRRVAQREVAAAAYVLGMREGLMRSGAVVGYGAPAVGDGKGLPS